MTQTVLSLTCSLGAAGSAAAQSVEPFSWLGGDDETAAYSISADGAVVVGLSSSGAVRWGPDGLLEILGDAGTVRSGIANAVSADGSVAVGQGINPDPFGYFAMRWRADGTAELLGQIVEGRESNALGVSADGTIAVGYERRDGTSFRPIMWDDNGTPNELELPDTWTSGNARDISADGSIIVGDGFGEGATQALLWREGDVETLDSLGYSFTTATAVNASGNIAVGYGGNGGNTFAIRWDPDGGRILSGLAFPDQDLIADIAHAVNADGSVVVGSSYVSDSDLNYRQEAVRWGSDGEVESLRDVLIAHGVDMDGIALSEAMGVSSDGRTIVGYTADENFIKEAWIFREDGLISLEAATRSLASLGQVGTSAQSYIDGLLGTAQEYALQHAVIGGSPETLPLGYAGADLAFGEGGGLHPENRRWRLFGYAEGHGRFDPDGGHGLGQLGGSYAVGPHAIVGAALGFGAATSDMDLGGKADLLGLSGTVFAAHAPPTGFQAVATATGIGFDADIMRGYANGAGSAISEGETSGHGYGASLRLGYAFETAPRATLTPFGALQIAHVELDGYGETSGPFPAEIGTIEDTATVARLGLEGRYDLSAESWLFGSAAWAHRFEDESAAVDAGLSGLFGVSGATMAVRQDWAELTGGISHGFGDGRSRVTASATLLVPGEDVSLTGRLGVSRAY